MPRAQCQCRVAAGEPVLTASYALAYHQRSLTGTLLAFLATGARGEAMMPERQFFDRNGRSWQVWEVCPDVVERRLSGEHATFSELPAGKERRRGERRVRLRVPDPLRHGWLAFETDGQRRRLAPVPAEWRALTDAQLARLLDTARVVESRAG